MPKSFHAASVRAGPAIEIVTRVAPFARIVVWSAAADGPIERATAVERGAVACVRKGGPLDALADTLVEQAALGAARA